MKSSRAALVDNVQLQEVSFREKMAKYISILQHSRLPQQWQLHRECAQMLDLNSSQPVHAFALAAAPCCIGSRAHQPHVRSDQQGEALNSAWTQVKF